MNSTFDDLQFDEVLSQRDQEDDLVKMIDPRLGDRYHLDSFLKVTLLCLKTSFRYIVNFCFSK